MGDDFLQRTTYALLVYLGYLATDADRTVSTEILGKLLQRLHQTIGRLIENHGPLLVLQCSQLCLPALLLRQKALEGKAVARQSATDQCRHKGRGTWQALHLDASPDGLAYQEEAWVADAWRTGIADECYGLSGQQAFDDTRTGAVLIELMVRQQMVFYLKMLQQDTAGTRILSQYQVGLLQDSDGAQRHVLHVSHRRGYNI